MSEDRYSTWKRVRCLDLVTSWKLQAEIAIMRSGNIFIELDVPVDTPRKVLYILKKMMVIFHPDKVQSRMTNLLPTDRNKLAEYAARLLNSSISWRVT